MDLSYALKRSEERLAEARKAGFPFVEEALKVMPRLEESPFFDPTLSLIFHNLALAETLQLFLLGERPQARTYSLLSNHARLLFEGVLAYEELSLLLQSHFQYRAQMLESEAQRLIDKIEPILESFPKDLRAQAVLLLGEMKKILALSADFGWEAKVNAYTELLLPKMQLLKKIAL